MQSPKASSTKKIIPQTIDPRRQALNDQFLPKIDRDHVSLRDDLFPKFTTQNRLVLHETPISKKALVLENQVASALTTLTAFMFKNEARGHSHVPDYGTLEYRYTPKLVEPVIRKFVQDVYQLGIDYTAAFFLTQGYLKPADDKPLYDMGSEMLKGFWIKIKTYLDRLKDREIDPSKRILNLKYMIGTAATTGATSTLKVAQMSKFEQMKDQFDDLYIDSSGLRRNKALDAVIRASGLVRFARSVKGIADRQNLSQDPKAQKVDPNKDVFFRWVAILDERTCIWLPSGKPGCGQLDFSSWNWSERFEVPTPGGIGSNPTHFNCRCRVLIDVRGDIFEY